MIFRFNLHKTVEAAGVILTQHQGRATRLRLLKLLYIADRERLAASGRTITGDHPWAMEHGPVLDDTYRLIKGTGYHTKAWDRHFRRDPFDGPGVTLAVDPGISALSRSEVETLHRVCREHVAESDWDLSILMHGFAEWDEAYRDYVGQRTSVRIPDDALLAAVGRAGDKGRLEGEAAADQEWAQLLGSIPGGDGADR